MKTWLTRRWYSSRPAPWYLRPLAWLFGVHFEGGLMGVWAAAGLYVVLLAVVMGAKFATGSWKTIKR